MPSKRFWIGATVALALVVSYNYAVAATMRAVSDEGEVLLLHDTPCTNPVILKLLQEIVPNRTRALQSGAYVSPDGKRSHMCWMLLPNLKVAVVHEDGAGGLVPMQAFLPVVTQ